MPAIAEIKVDPQIVAKLETLCQRCQMETSGENLNFLFNYLIRVAMLQIEDISFFVTPNSRPVHRPS